MAIAGFTQGARDGYPIYNLIRHPNTPKHRSAGYGGGMALAGVGSMALGLVPIAGLLMLRGHNGRAIGTVPTLLAGVWALPHVIGGLMTGIEGVTLLAQGAK